MLKVYVIEDVGGYSQRHTVVAESYEKAAILWKKEYKSEPISIRLFSEYVIVQKESE